MTAISLASWLMLSAVPARAQQNPPPLPSPEPGYAYAVEGRRDPFVPTVGREPVAQTTSRVARPAGIGGVMVAEISVRGLLESHGAWIAMVRAADGRTYTVHTGDRLMDGTIRDITADMVLILLDAHDALSTAPQREVRKLLRGGEQIQ